MQAVVNARIYTMDESIPLANSMLIESGRVRWIGVSEDPLDVVAMGASTVHDFGNDVVIPGLVDAHTHLEQIAYSAHLSVNCRSSVVSSISEIIETIERAADDTPAGEWIFAQGEHYQELKLAEGRLPDRFDLDRATTAHPVVYRSSYHTNVFSSLALQQLGVTRDTPDAPGGRIEHSETDGEPTGRTYDMFAALEGPEASVEALEAAIAEVQSSYLALGVTSIGDIPLHRNGYEAVRRLDDEGRLRLRVALYPKVPTVIDRERMEAVGAESRSMSGRCSLAGFKVFLDGGLTAGAAALHDAYPDKPGFRGEILYSQQELCDLIEICELGGNQLAIHAIGDRALDHLLRAFESYVAAAGSLKVRHRLEHAGNIFLDESRRERIRALGVIAVPQPSFLLTTADGYRAYLGDRIEPVMPFKSMLAEGLTVPGSSDAIGITATQHHPFPAMDAAVTRVSHSGGTLGSGEGVAPIDALGMYTRHGAAALGWENEVGILAVEAMADFVRIGTDPIQRGTFEGTAVLETWIGGELVYEA
ncbi:amidohydrolase [Okibacterium endophyticum]